jgi:hypothetical protein
MSLVGRWRIALVAGAMMLSWSAPIMAGSAVDVPDKHWAAASVEKLIERGVIKLDPKGKFQGGKALTRYEMAELVHRTLEQMDEVHAAMMSKDDANELKQLVRDLADEIVELRAGRDEDQVARDALMKDWEEFKKEHATKIKKLEETRSSIKWTGNSRFRYQHTQVDDGAKGKGSTRRNGQNIRLDGRIPVDPSMFMHFRLRVEQPMRRLGDNAGGTSTDNGSTFHLQYLYLDKKDVLGGDWRIGRQYDGIGNNFLFVDYYDGFTYKAKMGHDKRWGFTGILLSQNTANTVAKSHGHHANILSVDYTFPKNHNLALSRYENNAESDKFGVVGSKERWGAIDIKGKFTDKWEYFGTYAVYDNQFGENDVTASKPAYLRGDTDNCGVIAAIKYLPNKKFNIQGMWTRQLDNFRAFDVLTDLYYLEIPYHPLEHTLNALSLTAQIPGFATPQGTLVGWPNRAAPAGGVAEGRPAMGAYLQDIHGFQDMQLHGEYALRSNLKLVVVGDWLKKAKSSYAYPDATAVTARLRYKYNPNHTIELRGIRVVVDNGRSANDLRTEYYIKF